LIDAVTSILAASLIVGSIYALVGVGWVTLYRATGVLNLAQGALMVAAAIIFQTMVTTYHLNAVLAFGISSFIVMAVTALAHPLLFRRLLGAELFTVVIASFGLQIVAITVVNVLWTNQTFFVPAIVSSTPLIRLSSFVLSPADLLVIGLSAALILLLELGFQRTRIGLQMRAVADGPLLAAYSGIKVNWLATLAWSLSGLCAAVAGIAYMLRGAVDPTGLTALGLAVFPAVFLGGMDSIKGALVGGMILALVEQTAQYYLGGDASEAAAYVVFLFALLVIPRGLFGKRVTARL
jgi:branched-chain amino acid transport system permease protein